MGRHTGDGEVNGVRRDAKTTVVNRRSESGVKQKQTHNRKGRGGRTLRQKFPWNTEGLPKTNQLLLRG